MTIPTGSCFLSSQARYDHFDTPPCVFFARFFIFLRRDQKPLRKELTERTTEYSIFEPVKNRTVTGFVRYETHSLFGDFECGPFDHLGISPFALLL